MTINIDNYDVHPNEDGSLGLTPKPGTDEALLAEYNALKREKDQAEHYKALAQTRIDEHGAKMQALRTQLEARGITVE